MKHRAIVLSLAASLVAAPPCRGQAPTQASLAARLRSPDVATRAAAFQALNRNPAIWSDPGMQSALLDLLERENELTDTGAASGLGEGYAEYETLVLNACLKSCNRQSARVNRAIADAPYSAFSDFAKQLAAEHGSDILPTILTNARSRFGGTRYDSIVMLANIARFAKGLSTDQDASIDSAALAAVTDAHSFMQREAGVGVLSAILQSGRSLTSERRAQFHAIVRGRATDAYPSVRVAAAKALGIFADPTDVGLLTRLAESDTSRVVNRGVTVFPVRVEAAQARARIRPK